MVYPERVFAEISVCKVAGKACPLPALPGFIEKGLVDEHSRAE
jgi:hypothetical protein